MLRRGRQRLDVRLGRLQVLTDPAWAQVVAGMPERANEVAYYPAKDTKINL